MSAGKKLPIIKLRDVCFSYGAHEVLHNVGFQVCAHEMLAIVGPNGGGKSTLLQLLLGLQSPRLGSVQIFGGPPRQARARVGYVPQHPRVDPEFPVSVLDVVRMGRVERHVVGPYRQTDDAAAETALTQAGIENLRHRSFAQLSGGQRQRVLIAQALATEAELLLLDEPTANVDPKAEHELIALFGRLRQHKTLVFVSHNVNVVTRHASHVLCVNRTALLHPIHEVMASTLREAYGGELAVLTHNQDCHVMDASQTVHSEHAAASGFAPKPSVEKNTPPQEGGCASLLASSCGPSKCSESTGAPGSRGALPQKPSLKKTTPRRGPQAALSQKPSLKKTIPRRGPQAALPQKPSLKKITPRRGPQAALPQKSPLKKTTPRRGW